MILQAAYFGPVGYFLSGDIYIISANLLIIVLCILGVLSLHVVIQAFIEEVAQEDRITVERVCMEEYSNAEYCIQLFAL